MSAQISSRASSQGSSQGYSQGSSSLQLKDLEKIFIDSHTKREIIAVNQVNLDIEAGELITLLGPSGCGKTTVLRMLAGFEAPTKGDILINQKSIKDDPPNKRNSAMVFQSYALFPHMSVEQNIAYGLKLRGFKIAQIKDKLDRFVEIVGLKGYEKRRPNELSGGQQQRVALARALIVEPEILLFDEPLSNLDAKLRETMRSEIRRIQKELNITSVYVTHDQVEAMAISDRIVVMNKGEVEQVGKPLDIYLRPESLFVADFMGAANFLEAKLKAHSEDTSSIEIHGHKFEVPYSNPNLSLGAELKVVIRPESVQVDLPGKSPLSAIVQDSQYLGSAHEYALELESGETLVGQEKVRSGGRIYQKGDRVSVLLKEQNLHFVSA